MDTLAPSTCSPVLFIIFKRPDTTLQVMEAIREARPAQLYIAADGPRAGRDGEAEACDKARKAALAVDWHCAVHTLFRGTNLGCKAGPRAAIDWFFEHESEGIILEDDVVPVQSFFPFCSELLERYRYDTRVSMISGNNFQQGIKRGAASYYFSRMNHTWGWATWRRAWERYDRDMLLWEPFKREHGFKQLGLTGWFEIHFTRYFDWVASGKLDTAWDYQWIFSGIAHNMYAIIPQNNLVTNIGWGPDATHTGNPDSWMPRTAVKEISFPLIHPILVAANREADLATVKKLMGPLRLLIPVVRRMRRVSIALIQRLKVRDFV
jgi:hypothetical protein